jgi:hypothetical protein
MSQKYIKPGILAFVLIVLFSRLFLMNETLGSNQQDIVGSERYPVTYYKLPKQSDWQEQGVAIKKGQFGSWDSRLDGMITPCTVIKKEGKYFLYYLGADGDRDTDMGPRNRAMGVAISNDGINFKKVQNNPIITHLPQNNQEEGVFSAGGMINASNDIALYYGAIFAANPTTEEVRANIKLATSRNGIQFDAQDYVVERSDPNVWGYGDELFPVGVFRQGNTQHIYYIAKGKEAFWDLGVLSTSDNLNSFVSRPILETGDVIGGGDPIDVGNNTFVIPLVRSFERPTIELRFAKKYAPDVLSEPQVTYYFENTVHMTIYYDREKAIWYMYYIDKGGTHIRVRTAQVAVDNT